MRTFFMRFEILVALLALLVAWPAAGQVGGVDPDLGEKVDAGGPTEDLAGDITRVKEEREEVERPTLAYDAFRFSVELQLKDKRAELMRTLEAMAGLNQDPEEKPSLLFRLAELSWEESRYWFFEANRQDDRIAICRESGDQDCVRGAERDKETYMAASRRYQDRAISTYSELIEQFPDYERVDEVLFYLGHNLWEAGRDDESLGAYRTLITRFPDSRFVPDAWLAFGEWYFNRDEGDNIENMSNALEAYIKAASYRDSKVFGFAVYKQGWCLYNLGDFAQAADKFKATVFYGQLTDGVGGENKTALIREARKDFVLAFSRYGDPGQAKAQMMQVGGEEHWWSMIKSLAGLYYDDGKDKEAVLIYRQLIRERPLSPEAPLFQARIVDAVMRVGNKHITVEQARLLVKIFEDVKSSGAVQSAEDQKLLEQAEKLSERTLSNLAVVWHNEGKRSMHQETFELASAVYSYYFDIFPDTEKAYSLRFYHGELLYDHLQNYEFAAAAYTEVVLQDIAKLEENLPPGKWLVAAAEGAIFANDQVVSRLPDDPPPPDADPHVPLQIPAAKAQLLRACDHYLDYIPDGDKRVEIAYKAAQIQYQYNHFEGAVARFSEIALEHPENALAEYSANLVLDVFNLLEDYESIDVWAKRFHAEPRLAKGSFKEDLERIIERNAFKLVALLEEEERYLEAADRYIAFVTEWPRSELAGEALFNASVDYYKAGRIEQAIDTRARLVSDYPHSKMAPMAIYMNASVFEEIGAYERAAAGYEAYAEGYAASLRPTRRGSQAASDGEGPVYEEEKARAALYNAGIFREALGDRRTAQRDRERYLELWPNSPDAEAIYLSIVDLLEAERNWNAAVRMLEAYERQHARSAAKSILARYRIAKIQETRGQRWPAADSYERIWEIYRRLPASSKANLPTEPGAAMEAVAEAHFRQSEATWREFSQIRLRLPPATMARDLEAKASALLAVERRYTETVAFGVPGPALCALTRIGLGYRDFAQSLYDAPAPRGMNEEQLLQYRQALSEQAFPVEIKAQEALAVAVAKSQELQVENDCSREALALLEEWAPDSFPPLLGELAKVEPPRAKKGRDLLMAVQPQPAPPPADAEPPTVIDEPIPHLVRERVSGPRDSLLRPRNEPPLIRSTKGDFDDEDLL